MYDRETGSLWVHVTGKAEHGTRKGWQLQQIPASVTPWGEWKRAHPNTLVLAGHRRRGFMGEYTGVESAAGIGLSVVVRFSAKLYPFEVLAGRAVVNDAFNGQSLVVAYSSEIGTAKAWGRQLDDVELTFEAAKATPGAAGPFLLRDSQSGTLWSWMTGNAVTGKYAGRQLAAVSHHPILNERFVGFYPNGPVLR